MMSAGARQAPRLQPIAPRSMIRMRQPATPTLIVASLAIGWVASGCGRMLVGRLPQADDAAADAADADAATNDRDGENRPDTRGAPDGNDARAGGDTSPGDDARETTDSSDGSDGSPDGDAAETNPGDGGATPPIGIIAGRITMSDNINVRGAGVAGVHVALSGPSIRSAISDTNGAFQFPGLAAGTYAVAVTKDGAAFTPPAATGVVVAAGDSAGAVANFACAAPCGTGPTIDADRELFIQDPSVLADDRASNATAGPWSFRFLMQQAAMTSASLFADSWIANLAASGRDVMRLRSQWPTVIENGLVLPDISRAPFQLLAIVNGIDAHTAGQGELRFVYGIHEVPGAPGLSLQGSTFTVMFTYALPATVELPNRQAWAARFHQLGAIPFGADYNTSLAALTGVVTRIGAQPSSADNPRGSALTSVRINEQFGNDPPQLRTFRLLPDPVRGVIDLVVAPVEQTPDAALNAHIGALPDFLNANAARVQAGFATIAGTFLTTVSPAFNPAMPWAFPSVNSEALRHAFAGQTCAGCHSSEAPSTLFTVFHVFPTSGASAGNRSGWVILAELPRRVSFMQNQLTCAVGSCALGGEPMMGEVR